MLVSKLNSGKLLSSKYREEIDGAKLRHVPKSAMEASRLEGNPG